MNILVIGTGYVGLVTGTCFAEMGNIVTCIDIDNKKIDSLNNGKVPIFEPGLDDMVKSNLNDKRLYFSSDICGNISKKDIIIIAVGTPENKDGSPNLNYVFDVAKEIGKNINSYTVIINKSTVPVGTAHQVGSIISDQIVKRGKEIDFSVVSNPEFLKEGDAINDFMRPDRIIIGSENQNAIQKIRYLYGPFTMNHDRLLIMGVKEAELSKYASNAMLAAKISFINEIASICDNLSIDIESVRKGIGSDSRIGYSFIYPGVGYGGSCFSKDVKALINTSKESGSEPLLLDAIEKRNRKQKQIMFKYVMDEFGNDIKNKIFTVWGLSFKPGTDDMREAPSIDFINSVINSGAKIQAFDPVANNEAIKCFPSDWIKDGRLIFFNDNYEALIKSNALVLMTEWKLFRNPIIEKIKTYMNDYIIFDGRNQFDPDYIVKNGFTYKGVGR